MLTEGNAAPYGRREPLRTSGLRPGLAWQAPAWRARLGRRLLRSRLAGGRGARLAAGLPRAGLHRRAGADLLETLDHHRVAGLQAAGDDPVGLDGAAGGHRHLLDLVFLVDQHQALGAVGRALQRLLRHQQRLVVHALLQLHAHIHARQQHVVRVRHFGAQVDLTGGRVDRDAGEQELARVRILGTVLQHHRGAGGVLADLLELAAGEGATQRRQIRGGLVEVDIDGVELLHRGHLWPRCPRPARPR